MTDFIEKQYSDDDDISTVATSSVDTDSDDLVDNINTPNEETEEVHKLTEAQIAELYRREYITKVKIIAFDSLGKDPLTNGSLLISSEKAKVINKMEEIMMLDESEITNIFNTICSEKIFSANSDYTIYPTYNNTQ